LICTAQVERGCSTCGWIQCPRFEPLHPISIFATVGLSQRLSGFQFVTSDKSIRRQRYSAKLYTAKVSRPTPIASSASFLSVVALAIIGRCVDNRPDVSVRGCPA